MLEKGFVTPIKVLLKSVAGFTGGLFGTLMILMIFAAGSSIVTGVLGSDEIATATINPVFLAVFLIMIFSGLIVANLFSTLLISFTDKDRYFKRNTILHHVFIFNILLFFTVMPFYIFSLVLNFGVLSIIALIHAVLSLLGSHLILESIANPRYNLLAIYGSSFGLIFGIISNIIVFKIAGTVNVLLFAFLPVTWLFLALFQAVSEALYGVYYKVYGVDFLKSDTLLGADYDGIDFDSEEDEINEEIENEQRKKGEPRDISGSDFLKGKK